MWRLNWVWNTGICRSLIIIFLIYLFIHLFVHITYSFTITLLKKKNNLKQVTTQKNLIILFGCTLKITCTINPSLAVQSLSITFYHSNKKPLTEFMAFVFLINSFLIGHWQIRKMLDFCILQSLEITAVKKKNNNNRFYKLK